ncbi:hypothetical protein J2S42_008130 [Catenuloplanes indicus]|uniref:Uncharacterized protein n=1 Tax=Catenuloplanes indicus TaxID=137267 RepID=A0AAE4B378_9ACTN|nr:hypothetical protein [Catenuloplanes indicus]
MGTRRSLPRKSWTSAVTVDDLVRHLTDDGVRLDLR